MPIFIKYGWARPNACCSGSTSMLIRNSRLYGRMNCHRRLISLKS